MRSISSSVIAQQRPVPQPHHRPRVASPPATAPASPPSSSRASGPGRPRPGSTAGPGKRRASRRATGNRVQDREQPPRLGASVLLNPSPADEQPGAAERERPRPVDLGQDARAAADAQAGHQPSGGHSPARRPARRSQCSCPRGGKTRTVSPVDDGHRDARPAGSRRRQRMPYSGPSRLLPDPGLRVAHPGAQAAAAPPRCRCPRQGGAAAAAIRHGAAAGRAVPRRSAR